MTTGSTAIYHQLTALRAEFERHAGRSLSLPIAGLAVWTAIGILGMLLEPASQSLMLVAATGAIFPVGLLLSKRLGERLVDNPSPLAGLMGKSVVMVNLLWALHVTLLFNAPKYLPLSLGIGLGLHWVVFGWIIGHPLGLIHAIGRTALVTVLWWAFPTQPVTAVAIGVAVAYIYSIHALATRQRTSAIGPIPSAWE